MILQITKSNIIDTTDSESMRKYTENLQFLMQGARRKGSIDRFALIRNDDFFPYNSEWIVNSENTNGEYRLVAIHHKKAPKNYYNKNGLNWFSKREKNQGKEEASDSERLYLYYPVAFRSTKHFTVNTALGTTGEYNLVKSNRKFTVIDGIANFLNSGYGYSLSERDAYLDVTHEPLKISDDAIILISSETYEQIKEDRELMEQISHKNLIIYIGDINTAINMVLTENGILPTRCEISYDDELKRIISDSFRSLCEDNNLEYDRPHGMNGHFTSYIDQYNKSTKALEREFVEFLNKEIGKQIINYREYGTNLLTELTNRMNNGELSPEEIEKIKSILKSFNARKKAEIEERRRKYLSDRRSVTPEISKLFKDTLALIRKKESEISFTIFSDKLSEDVISFFIEPTVNGQIAYANKINSYFSGYSAPRPK